MRIGIDASRAFLKNRTGIGEYSYRVIEHLRNKLSSDAKVFVYMRPNERSTKNRKQKRFYFFREEMNPGDKGVGQCDPERSYFPRNWQRREIIWRRFWTQGGLAWEMFRRPVDVLFVSAHIIPWIHPKKTILVVHGLEYEFCPGAYSFWERWYMRISIWISCRWASKIIAVSENTKRDLMRLYGVSEEKIVVIHEGAPIEYHVSNTLKEEVQNTQYDEILNTKYLLFIGRIEERKNVVRIIEAFEILKKRHHIPHKLVLVGKAGYGYEKVRSQKLKAENREDIIELGYVNEEEKVKILTNADVFLFPSLYEGFGLPILEAQAVGVPVVTSNVSSMPEIVSTFSPRKGRDVRTRTEGVCVFNPSDSGTRHFPLAGEEKEECSAVLVDPLDRESIAEGIYSILSDDKKREQLILLGYENVKRFSWEKCSKQIADILMRNM